MILPEPLEQPEPWTAADDVEKGVKLIWQYCVASKAICGYQHERYDYQLGDDVRIEMRAKTVTVIAGDLKTTFRSDHPTLGPAFQDWLVNVKVFSPARGTKDSYDVTWVG